MDSTSTTLPCDTEEIECEDCPTETCDRHDDERGEWRVLGEGCDGLACKEDGCLARDNNQGCMAVTGKPHEYTSWRRLADGSAEFREKPKKTVFEKMTEISLSQAPSIDWIPRQGDKLTTIEAIHKALWPDREKPTTENDKAFAEGYASAEATTPRQGDEGAKKKLPTMSPREWPSMSKQMEDDGVTPECIVRRCDCGAWIPLKLTTCTHSQHHKNLGHLCECGDWLVDIGTRHERCCRCGVEEGVL